MGLGEGDHQLGFGDDVFSSICSEAVYITCLCTMSLKIEGNLLAKNLCRNAWCCLCPIRIARLLILCLICDVWCIIVLVFSLINKFLQFNHITVSASNQPLLFWGFVFISVTHFRPKYKINIIFEHHFLSAYNA